MHDPSFLALSVHSPIPKRKRWGPPPAARWSLGRSTRTNDENLGEPTYPWWQLHGYSPVLAGCPFTFSRVIVNVWHEEPGGRDSGEVCGYPHGLRLLGHLGHLRVRIPVLLEMRRRLLTRCSWCGGRSGKGRDCVNVRHSWQATPSRWWQGAPGLFHSDCSGVQRAYAQCVCGPLPVEMTVEGGGCPLCNLRRVPGLTEPARHALLLTRMTPPGVRLSAMRNVLVRKAWETARHLESTDA